MNVTELMECLELCRRHHGCVHVVVRHAARHEFSPTDNLAAVRAEYDADEGLFVIYVEN